MSTTTKLTYDQFQEMIQLGLFLPAEDHRVELIFGEVVPIDPGGPMSPINPPHDDTVDELIAWTQEALAPGTVRIRAQGSIGIPEFDSQTQPDFLWLSPRRYSERRPRPVDILLLVEVSDTSLAKDRGEKARLYVRAGLRDYWIINLKSRSIEVRRDPVGDEFRSILHFGLGQEVAPLAFPEAFLPVSRIFPA